MTGEQVALVNSVALILESIGSWPIATVFLVSIVAPWGVLMLVGQAQQKRFEAVVKMYENNVELVRDYNFALREQQKLSGDLADIIHLNTQVQTQLAERITTNMFCPIVRERRVQP